MLKYLVIISLVASGLRVQAEPSHVNLNIKISGLNKILGEVINHYRQDTSTSTFVIPKANISGKIKQNDIVRNPIIQALTKKYLKFDLNTDLDFLVNWDDIKVEAEIDKDSIGVYAMGKDQYVNFAIKANFKKLSISGKFIEICEFVNPDKSCNTTKGLYGRFDNFSLSLEEGTPFNTLVKTSINIKKQSLDIDFNKFVTNIFSTRNKLDKIEEHKYGISNNPPKFALNFERFFMPPPMLIVNGKSFIINVDHIEQVMRVEKDFLAQQLVSAAGEFIAKDMVRLINEKVQKHIGRISKHFKLIDYNKYKSRNQNFLDISSHDPVKGVKFLMRSEEEKSSRVSNPIEEVKEIFSQMIYSAENELSLESVKAVKQKFLTLNLKNSLIVNNKNIEMKKTYWNGQRELKTIDFSQISEENHYDTAFSISEPLINSLINSSVKFGALDKVFQKIVDKPGVSINELNLHFVRDDRTCSLRKIKAVAILKIRLSKLKREGAFDYITYKAGEIMESRWEPMFSESSPLKYPVEQDLVVPVELDLDFTLSEFEERTILSLQVNPSLSDEGFKNTFDYPIMDMSNLVKESVFSNIKEGFHEIEGKVFDLDITEYVQKIPGIKLQLKDILMDGNGHLVFALDINKLDLDIIKEMGK
jgi:hypothetical protein